MSLRLLYAGLFILVGLLGAIVIVPRMFPDNSLYEGKLLGPTIVGLVVAAYFIFNERSPWARKDGVLRYRHREELMPEVYHARRALELRDMDTGDGWYLIELNTGKVLCLWDNLPSGPLGFDPANPEVKRFPCTEFTVLRHAGEGFTAEVICAGQVIKPETFSLPEHFDDWLYTHLPKDGDVIADKTFDEMQAEVQKVSGGSEW